MPFVQVQAARDHVAGEEDVRQSVIIDVADGDAGAVVDVDVGLDIQRVIGGDGVRERDAGLVGAQELEQRAIPLASRCRQKRDKNHQEIRLTHAG